MGKHFEGRLDGVGRLMIPASVRKQFDLVAGDTLQFVILDEGIFLLPTKNEIAELIYNDGDLR